MALTFVGFLAAVCLLNLAMVGFGADFTNATYLFVLNVPDLVPNAGLYWYFFTEMFDHFRVFFACVFQLNAFVFTIPLAVRLRDEPLVCVLLQVEFR